MKKFDIEGIMLKIIFFLLIFTACNIKRVYGQGMFVLVDQLPHVATSIKFDEEGNRLVTLQDGRVYENDNIIYTVPNVWNNNEMGLVSCIRDGDYYYFHASLLDTTQSILRWHRPSNSLVTILAVPYTEPGVWPPYAKIHRGGDLGIYDNHLYCSFGYGIIPMRAQELDNFRGKLVKIDLITEEPEIVLFGLRNPYRFSIHPENGDGFVTDVGSNIAEEINYFTSEYSLVNCGFPCYEGETQIIIPDDPCDGYGLSFPEYWYPYEQPSAIIGGTLYDDAYLFCDHYSGEAGWLDYYSWEYFPDSLTYPTFTTGMAVDPIDSSLYLVTWGGSVYQWYPDMPTSTYDPRIDADQLLYSTYIEERNCEGFIDLYGRSFDKPIPGQVMYDCAKKKIILIPDE